MPRGAIPLFLLLFFCSGLCHSQGNSLLWRITGNGLTEPSYLYGTMHSTDRRVFHFADSVMPALERCQSFAMEVVLDEAAQRELLSNIFMSGNTTIRSLLTAPQYDSLQRFSIREASVNIGDFDRMKPLYVAMMLEMLAADDSMINTSDPFLDQFLENTARNQRKPVKGLETAAEQLSVFDALSYPDQASLLMKTIREFSEDTADYQRMVQYYLNNELSMMMEFENDIGIPDTLYDALITHRNLRMAERIDTMVRASSVFIAVGAGHLGGQTGLVALLRDRKYTVVPVIPEFEHYLHDGWYRFVSTTNSLHAEFPEPPETMVSDNGLSKYTASLAASSGRKETFSILCFPPGNRDAAFREAVPEQSQVIFNDAEDSFHGESNGMKVDGRVICSTHTCYLLLHESRGKSKSGNRFFESFTIHSK